MNNIITSAGWIASLTRKPSCIVWTASEADRHAAFPVPVISFSKYEVGRAVPFFLFPVLLMTIGEIPLLFILKKVLLVSPFAVFIGIFNPLLDTGQALVFLRAHHFGGMGLFFLDPV